MCFQESQQESKNSPSLVLAEVNIGQFENKLDIRKNSGIANIDFSMIFNLIFHMITDVGLNMTTNANLFMTTKVGISMIRNVGVNMTTNVRQEQQNQRKHEHADGQYMAKYGT